MEPNLFYRHRISNFLQRQLVLWRNSGEILYLEPTEQGLMVRAFNRTGTAYAVFLFNTHFFSEVELNSIDLTKDNTCRLSMKAALSTFKSANFSDRNFLACNFRIDPVKDFFRMEMQLVHEVCRLFQLNFMERKSIKKAMTDKQKLANLAVCPAETLLPLIDQVQSKIDELIIHAKRDRICIKNFMLQLAEKKRAIKSEATMLRDQFLKLNVRRETEIAFSAKEFKAIIQFASQHSATVSLYFDQPSKPIIIAIEGDLTYASEFHLSTIEMDYTGCDTTNVERSSARSSQNNGIGSQQASGLNGSQQQLEHDSFDEDENNVPQSSNRMQAVMEQNDEGLMNENDEPMRDCDGVNDDDPGLPPTPPFTHRTNSTANDNDFSQSAQNHERMGMDELVAEKQPQSDVESIPGSPQPPPTKRDKIFRKFFMSHEAATQHASQVSTQPTFMVDETHF
ncbi:unnamed protein product, partial [Mesorhabditis belari]|uniref:Uncharacterized protein n=1 Tax=Mesorhabditis belari TaxID=2138241 RepID=A0AAF3J2E4_9BILA